MIVRIFRVVNLRKRDVIESLIEMSTWRKQVRYATKVKRYDLALQAVDNCLALTTKAIQAMIKPRARKPKKML